MESLLAYGGGTNSLALVVEMKKRGIRPSAIVMGDTGGELPHIYSHVAKVSAWLEERQYPAIQLLRRNRKDGSWESLEDECLRRHALPSIAYGFKTCSQKFKVEPQDKFANNFPPFKAAWARGEKVVKYIGYDYGEFYRAKFCDDNKWELQYPLIDWRMTRADCVRVIAEAGLEQPGKSSCFFCPHMKANEVRELEKIHPELLARALAMEANADLTEIRGLGRSWAWSEALRQPTFLDQFDASGVNCDCFEAADDLPVQQAAE